MLQYKHVPPRLSAAGWYKVDVEDALELYDKLSKHLDRKPCDDVPPPRPTVIDRIVPRVYDSAVVAVAVSVFVLSFVVYMLLR